MAKICGSCNTERMFTLTRGAKIICVDCHNKETLTPQPEQAESELSHNEKNDLSRELASMINKQSGGFVHWEPIALIVQKYRIFRSI